MGLSTQFIMSTKILIVLFTLPGWNKKEVIFHLRILRMEVTED